MPKLTIDGVEIEVAPGTTVLQAALSRGAEIPHYCYHPGLSIAGNCRMCLIEVEKAPKLLIGCATQCTDGMVVHTQSEKVKAGQRDVMEFLLKNHPLDCPVCDQAGECLLQDFYMQFAQHDSRLGEHKNRKLKAKSVGPRIVLDQERCIICTRCVRFLREVTKTGELGVFGRGSRERLDIFPGHEVDNDYAGSTSENDDERAAFLQRRARAYQVWYEFMPVRLQPPTGPDYDIYRAFSHGDLIRFHVLDTRQYRADQQRNEAFLEAAPSLRIVANVAVGYNNVDVAACAAREVVVTNTPGVLTDATADLAMALILMSTRRLGEGERLIRSGAGRFFIDLAVSLTGYRIGGPAKAAAVASGFMGTVSGSAVANVVTTGSFTIPLMSKVGYRPKFAAAVEACASSGGQITPPIMGAAAFIIAEFLGVSYVTVIVAAVIPALLYFATIYFMVHLEAEKHGIGFERLYGTPLHLRGATVVDMDIKPLDSLTVLTPEETGRPEFTIDGWLDYIAPNEHR